MSVHLLKFILFMASGFYRKKIYLLLLFLIPLKAFAVNPKDCEKLIVEGIRLMNKKDFKNSLHTLIKAKNTAHQNKFYREEFLAINNIGANYYMRFDYGEALKNYFNAYKIALSHLDEKSEMTVLNNIAILYSKDKKFKKAKENFLSAYQLAEKVNNKVSKGMYGINLAIVSNEMQDYAEAKRYIDEAHKLTEKSPYFLLAQTTYVETLVNLKQFDEAQKEAKILLPKLKSVEYAENKTQIYYNLSTVAEYQNDLATAFRYLKLADKSNYSYDYKLNIFEKYSELYEKENNIGSAVSYKDSIIAVKDSLNTIKNGQLFENSKIKFELENSKLNLAKSEDKILSQRLFFIAGIFVFIFLATVVFWALRNSIAKNKQQKIIEINKAKIAGLQLEKEKKNKLLLENKLKEKEVLALLEKEKHKNEIEIKNQKLTAKALQLSNKKDLINDLVKTLSQQAGSFEDKGISAVLQQLKVFQRQTRDEESFFVHFEEVNQGFISKLKIQHKELKSNDIRFLSYVYMNLSIKEISSLLNITPEACRKRKERVSKKMQLDDAVDLYDYITGI